MGSTFSRVKYKICPKSLSNADLDFLKHRTKYSEAEIRAWYKRIQSSSPDLLLNQEQFLAAFQDLYPSQWEEKVPGANAKEFTKFVFEAFNEDKDPFLSFREFLFFVNYISDGSPEEKLEASFNIYDINNNGLISETELFQVLKALLVMLSGTSKGSATRTKVLMDKLDKDKNGQIDKREFLDACKHDEELFNLLIDYKPSK